MVRESRISYRRCLVKLRYFCAVYKYAGNADRGKGYWDIKRKFGVTTHFSEISKLQFGKKWYTSLCILAPFRIFVALLSIKKCIISPQISFWIPIVLAKMLFPHSYKLCKKTSVLVGNVLNEVINLKLCCLCCCL